MRKAIRCINVTIIPIDTSNASIRIDSSRNTIRNVLINFSYHENMIVSTGKRIFINYKVTAIRNCIFYSVLKSISRINFSMNLKWIFCYSHLNYFAKMWLDDFDRQSNRYF